MWGGAPPDGELGRNIWPCSVPRQGERRGDENRVRWTPCAERPPRLIAGGVRRFRSRGRQGDTLDVAIPHRQPDAAQHNPPHEPCAPRHHYLPPPHDPPPPG